MALWQVCRVSGNSWKDVYALLQQVFASIDHFNVQNNVQNTFVTDKSAEYANRRIWVICRQEHALRQGVGVGRDRCVLRIRGVEVGFLCSCDECMGRKDELYMTDNFLQNLRLQTAESFFVLGTSATTAEAKYVVLSPDALIKSAASSQEAIGAGRGTQWLLCLPVFYISGFMVLMRSVLAGTVPRVLEGGFGVDAFLHAAEGMESDVRCVSLVPFQLQMLLQAEERARVDRIMQSFTAILVGGQAVSCGVTQAALARGWRVVVTYGASETCGGCVYNALPLKGFEVRTSAGNVYISGVGLACGYLRLAQPPKPRDGGLLRFYASIDTRAFFMYRKKRWYRTGDLGEMEGRAVTFADHGLFCSLDDEDTKYLPLRITGRVDRVITSGGMKVNLDYVARLVRERTWFKDCVTVPVPSVWGESVVLVVVADPLSRKERMCGAGMQEGLERPGKASAVPNPGVRAQGDLCVDISGIYLSRVIRALSDCPSSARPIAIYELNAWPVGKSGKIDLVQVSDLVRSHYDCIEHTD